jgi:hypothetical protein
MTQKLHFQAGVTGDTIRHVMLATHIFIIDDCRQEFARQLAAVNPNQRRK